MADIELVIKITKEDLRIICERTEKEIWEEYGGIDQRLMKAVQNGTPLPKGHGRLIDASKLPLNCGANEYGCDKICLCDGCIYAMVSLKTINNAQTIIEADKEENKSEI